MIRVLQVLGSVGLGGAESRIMDLYRHMDREKIQFDFLITRGNSEYYKDEIESLGGKVYYLPAFRVINYAQYRKAVRAFFRENAGRYAAVHGHMTSTAAIYLPIAKKEGVPLTIAHARSAGVDPGLKGYVTRHLRLNLRNKCDKMLACSREAGESVFGKGADFVFMPNAIDSRAFAYDKGLRDSTREKYGIKDEILIGHVGSFRYAKNHEWVLKVFKEFLKLCDGNARLFLAGDGERREEMTRLAQEMGLGSSVIFAGNISDTPPIYDAFDCLLFPSRYEGMPGTVVEAAASGLSCLISDSITSQVVITDSVVAMSLERSASEWAGELMRLIEADRMRDRGAVVCKDGRDLADTMYDVNCQVDYYMTLYGEKQDEDSHKT